MTQSRCVVSHRRCLHRTTERREQEGHLTSHLTSAQTVTHGTCRLRSSENYIQATMKRLCGFRRCTAKRHWRSSEENYKTNIQTFFWSLNIPWCKRKLLNVFSLRWATMKITQDFWWMCVHPLAALGSFSFALYFNATLLTILWLAKMLAGSTCWYRLLLCF